MQFNNFLAAYYRDTSYGGDRLYADVLAQAKLVDRLGFRGVTIPEHRGPSPENHDIEFVALTRCRVPRVWAAPPLPVLSTTESTRSAAR